MASFLRALFGGEGSTPPATHARETQIVTAASGKFLTRRAKSTDGSGLAKITHSRERSQGIKPVHDAASYTAAVLSNQAFSQAIVAEACPDLPCPIAGPDGTLGYVLVDSWRSHPSWKLLARPALYLPNMHEIDLELYRELHGALLERAFKLAKSRGYESMCLELSFREDFPDSKISKDLYIAKGFEVSRRLSKVLRRDDLSKDMDVLFLQKNLNKEYTQIEGSHSKGPNQVKDVERI